MSRQNNSASTSFSHDYIQNSEQQKATSYLNMLSFLNGRRMVTDTNSESSMFPASDFAVIIEKDISEATQSGKSYADKVRELGSKITSKKNDNQSIPSSIHTTVHQQVNQQFQMNIGTKSSPTHTSQPSPHNTSPTSNKTPTTISLSSHTQTPQNQL